jgi:para-nitrobenzyl esterase
LPAFNSGNFNNVPIILGANEYEQKAFMPLFGGALKGATGTIPSAAGKSWLDLLDVAFEGTQTIDDVLPTQKDKDTYEVTGYNGGRAWRAKYVDELARVITQYQPNTYAYDFRWGTQSGPAPFNFIYGAGHAAEISFFHGAGEGLFSLPFTAQNEPGRKDLQNAMMDYLADFARGGNPNGDFSKDELAWQPWSNTAGADKVIVFDATDAATDISMSNEGLTLPGVNTAWTAAMTNIGLGPVEQGTLRAFFGQSASYSTP